MGGRFSLAVFVVLGLAVVIGVFAGRSQAPISASPEQPTALPTPVPTAAPFHINILPDPARAPVGTFDPMAYTVRVGQKITWMNMASNDHTVTADNGAFNSDVLAPGQSFSWTPKKPGTYRYSCFIHPEMRASIVVKP